MNELDLLLRKHREGTITSDEQERLNQLTRRDEVMNAASRRAGTMRRRRQVILSLSAMVLLLGGAGATLFFSPSPSSEAGTPVVAQSGGITAPASAQAGHDSAAPAQLLEAVQAQLLDDCVMAAPLDDTRVEMASNNVSAVTIEKVAPQHAQEYNTSISDEIVAPEVLCNLGCDADSVINEVWDFLNA